MGHVGRSDIGRLAGRKPGVGFRIGHIYPTTIADADFIPAPVDILDFVFRVGVAIIGCLLVPGIVGEGAYIGWFIGQILIIARETAFAVPPCRVGFADRFGHRFAKYRVGLVGCGEMFQVGNLRFRNCDARAFVP
jgi:hypothetical protein